MTSAAQPAATAPETDTRRVIVSEDLPLTVLTAVATTLVMSAVHLGRSLLYIGVALSPLVADVTKNAFRGLRKRWLSLLAALLVLLGTAGRALAARLRTRQDRAVGAHAMVSTALLSAALTVGIFTVWQLGSGNATTFFGSAGSPHHAPPQVTPPPVPRQVPVKHVTTGHIVLTLPNRPITAEAAGPTGARAAYPVSAAAGGRHLVVACKPPSGSLFPIGETTVTCSAAAGPGRRATGRFQVVVRDDMAPVLRLPSGQSVKTADASGRAFVYAAAATDRVDGAVRASCKPASGSRPPVGTTTVTCTATDAHGNRASGSFAVEVELSKQRDAKPPKRVLPSEISREATSPAGAVVTYSASAMDGIDGSVATSCLPASGSTFPLGTTRVHCSAHDAKGNLSSSGFPVTVVDTTAPVIAPLADLKAEAISSYGALVDFKPTATDIVDGEVTPVCTWAPGAAFPLGVTAVSCTAKDARGNSSSGGFSVTVVDTTAPAIKVPGELTVEATSSRGAAVRYAVSATDIVSGTVPATCTSAPGAFPLGPTTVTCSAVDARGNRGSAAFTVNVVDHTPPMLHLPDNFTIDAGYTHGATVTYTATATDTVDGKVAPSCTIPSGTWVPVSRTTTKTIQCTAVDSHGNRGIGSFTVTIRVSVGSFIG
jgi:hypothetical protein